MSKKTAHPDLSRTMRIDLDAQDLVELRAVYPRRDTGDRIVLHRDDVTDRRETAFDKLLESIYDAVVITDNAGRIMDFNSRAVEFFHASRENMPGMAILSLIQGAEPSLLAAIESNLRDHRYTLIEARCRQLDGATFPAEIAVNRVELEPFPRLCFFIRDITVRKRAFEALENAVARLEDYDRARSEFVSNVSHELRTPLTSMIYALHNMLNGVVGPLPERAIGYLERLDSDCHRLLNTVNDILDLRQIENKTLSLAQKPIPLLRLVEECASSMRLQAEQKRLTLTLDLPGQDFFVVCDPLKIERVVINMLGNAIKFTPAGGTIEVGLDFDPEQPGYILLKVLDSGIGIPPEAIAKVTLRYFKVGEQPIGSGLGLAIAKEIVELHGGRISLRSPVPGRQRGTAVYVWLPVARAPDILIAAADSGPRAGLGRHLADRGYPVQTVGDAGELMRKLKENDFGALLLDTGLPGGDSMELILSLKQNKATAGIRVVALLRDDLAASRLETPLRGLGIPRIALPWSGDRVASELADALYGKPSGVGGDGRRLL